MRHLFHLWLSPASRKVRIALAEKGLDFELQVEKIWERREEFLSLNPAGDVPVLVEADGSIFSDSQAICEYLDEVYQERPLIGTEPRTRAEVRRLTAWFDHKFGREVSEVLIEEKLMKRFMRLGAPDSAAIRFGQRNIHTHLAYIGYLAERRSWLAGKDLSLADITAGAHLSAVDYLADVPWEDYPQAKEWYARIKSRPSFRAILADFIPGLPPPRHYADLDF